MSSRTKTPTSSKARAAWNNKFNAWEDNKENLPDRTPKQNRPQVQTHNLSKTGEPTTRPNHQQHQAKSTPTQTPAPTPDATNTWAKVARKGNEKTKETIPGPGKRMDRKIVVHRLSEAIIEK